MLRTQPNLNLLEDYELSPRDDVNLLANNVQTFLQLRLDHPELEQNNRWVAVLRWLARIEAIRAARVNMFLMENSVSKLAAHDRYMAALYRKVVKGLRDSFDSFGQANRYFYENYLICVEHCTMYLEFTLAVLNV